MVNITKIYKIDTSVLFNYIKFLSNKRKATKFSILLITFEKDKIIQTKLRKLLFKVA